MILDASTAEKLHESEWVRHSMREFEEYVETKWFSRYDVCEYFIEQHKTHKNDIKDSLFIF